MKRKIIYKNNGYSLCNIFCTGAANKNTCLQEAKDLSIKNNEQIAKANKAQG